MNGYRINSMLREFICAACGYSYYTTSTLIEKAEEFLNLYGQTEEECDEDIVSVCDSCYDIALKFYNES